VGKEPQLICELVNLSPDIRELPVFDIILS
jgi:hypothetical protein